MNVDSILEDVLNTLNESTTPDVLLLRQVIEKTEEIMGITLGVLVWALIVGVFVVTAIDLIYLNLPNLRQSLEDMNQVSRIRFISHDAINALNQGYVGNDKSPNQLYCGKRMKTYVATILIVVIMITGTWDIILDFLVKIATIIITWFWTM